MHGDAFAEGGFGSASIDAPEGTDVEEHIARAQLLKEEAQLAFPGGRFEKNR